MVGDGHNNIILNTNSFDLQSFGINVNKAILVQANFTNHGYRKNYDIIIPNLQLINNISINNFNDYSGTMLSPAKRKYFLSFLGHIEGSHNNKETISTFDDDNLIFKQTMLNLLSKHSIINHNEFLFDFDCDDKTKRLCDNQTIILLDSTFVLINVLNNSNQHYSFNEYFTLRFFNALSTGNCYFFFN